MSTNKKKMTLGAKVKKYKSLIPFIIPAVLFALIFSYLPMTGILIAFKDNPNFLRYDVFEAFQRSEWTLENFKILFSDPEILSYIRNTLIISVMKIVILFPLPVILAVMITELRSKRFSKLVQGIVFLPHFFSWVVIVGIFNSIFGMYGPINNLSVALGGEAVHFMGEPGWFRWLVVILSGWKEIGYSSIAYIAAIMSIDPALYEAAKIDGANKWETLKNVTIPMVMPSITICTFLTLSNSFKLYDQNLALTNGAPMHKTEMLALNIVNTFYGRSGYEGVGQAKAVIFLVIVAVIALSQLYFTRKREVEQ